jgi:hypothetical protein
MIEYNKRDLKKLTKKSEITIGGCYLVFTSDWIWISGKYLWVKVKKISTSHIFGTWTFSDGKKSESTCDINALLKDGYILEQNKTLKIYGIVEFCRKYY